MDDFDIDSDDEEHLQPIVPVLPSVASLQEADIYKYSGARKYATLADVVLQSDLLVMYGEQMYHYDEEHGCWKHLTKKSFDKIILQSLQEVLTEIEFKSLPVKGLETIREKIRWVLLTRRGIPEFNANPNMINVLNGVIEITQNGEIEISQHNPRFFFDYCLNFNYIFDTERKATPVFDQYCSKSFLGDVERKRKLWLQMLGYCCSDSVKGKCCFILVGCSNSGKTVTTEAMEEIFPEESRSSISLYDLENPFARIHLAGKKVNIQSELPSNKFSGVDYIKAITSGDTISGAFKGKDYVFFRTKCKLLLATNTLPQPESADPTEGFLNRLIILFYPVSIPKEEQDPKLLEKMKSELDDIASCAIDEYAELLQNNFAFEEPEDSKRYKEMYRNFGNPFSLFVQDKLVVHPAAKVHVKELKAELKLYESENGLEALPDRKMREFLQGIKGVTYARFSFKKKNIWGFRGIGLKSDFPELVQEINSAEGKAEV